ncbi:CPCC family cysteine-rich protein [Listeria booriae]|uniref:Cysteine-rich CPCC domain-containing protein n=1 Tax=Listeria booriae TaxID=1552123 RepID=A0A7X0YIM6_9LIST|nr:CPCC family cysteine-rich protein [Listeria booriae]MBC2115167.1 hypothetical protein [Listeria booriae]
MEREKALSQISENRVEKLSPEQREALILDWWGIDEDDVEYMRLPIELRVELTSCESPESNVMNPKYNPLLVEAIKSQYIGVKNSYLAKYLSSLVGEIIDVTGHEEVLLECFCCHYLTIKERGNYEICAVCGWEDDGSNNKEIYSNANHMTLLEGQANFQKKHHLMKTIDLETSLKIREKYFLAK